MSYVAQPRLRFINSDYYPLNVDTSQGHSVLEITDAGGYKQIIDGTPL
jgi:hypothetical protein